MHCDEKDREKLYLEIKGIYEPEDLRFTVFFNIFRKMAQNSLSRSVFQAFEENEELEFILGDIP